MKSNFVKNNIYNIIIVFVIICLILVVYTFFLFANSHDATNAWEKLASGNAKFVNSPLYPPGSEVLANGQNPSYVVLGCADSRVPPEIIFSQGVGDLFVCRVAGNVADNVVIDSIEYAI